MAKEKTVKLEPALIKGAMRFRLHLQGKDTEVLSEIKKIEDIKSTGWRNKVWHVPDRYNPEELEDMTGGVSHSHSLINPGMSPNKHSLNRKCQSGNVPKPTSHLTIKKHRARMPISVLPNGVATPY